MRARQALADDVEEHVGELDDGGRNRVVAGLGEDRHQLLRLRFQRLEIPRRLRGHPFISLSPSPAGDDFSPPLDGEGSGVG